MIQFTIPDKDGKPSKEDWKALDNIIKLIATKYAFDRDCDLPDNIQIGFAYHSPNLLQSPNKEITAYNISQLLAALVRTEELKEAVGILVNDEGVFFAEKGQVIKDSLNLVSSMKEFLAKENSNHLREREGTEVVKYASVLLAFYGQKSNLDGSVVYEGHKYNFSEKDGQLKVSTKDGNREIMNNEGFTEKATSEDKAAMQELEKLVEQLKAENKLIPPSGLKL